ncbi:MAG: oligosaccharide flippase family protein [Lachnospiraceae bacterium]|nr:oligosaccharide flippase family protein [Lachnospiraceae bacterium]
MDLLKKYKNMPIQAKASIWYTICNFLQKGISFLVVPLYVRLLTTAEYGDWSVFQSWRDILIIFATLNLYAGVYTKTLVDNKDDRDRYTSSMQGLGTLITICLLGVYFITHEWCNHMIGLSTPYMLLLFLYFILYPAFSFWGTRQRVENNYRAMVIVTVIVSVLTPTVSILLLLNTDLREKALIVGYLSVQCAVGLVFYVYNFVKGRCFCDKKYWVYSAKFNIPLIPHYLSLIVLGQSDRIMIKHYCGEDDAGIYSFAYQIASVMNMFLSAINGSRVPWSYEKLRDRVYTRLKKLSNALCVMFGGITLMAALMAPDIIRILGTAEYEAATYVIPIVALGVYFTFVYDMFCTVEFYYGATKYVMVASVVGALSNMILNALLIPVFGFIAAAYTTLGSYIMFVFMHYIFMHVVMKQQKIEEEVYDIRFTIIFSLGLCTIVFASLLTYESIVVRYLFIVALITIAVVFRNRIMDTLKLMKK